MWRLCALALSLTACGIGFQSGDAVGGGAPDGGAGGVPGAGGAPSPKGAGGSSSSATGGSSSSAIGGSSPAAGGGGEAGGSACEPGLEVAAAVAECIRHSAPDPDACEQLSSVDGTGEMDVDESADSTVGNIARAYLRFDLPPGAQAATGFVLRLTNTGTGGDANSPGSGAVFHVQPFQLSDLFNGPPARVSETPVAPGQGPVSDREVVDWPVPVSVIDSARVHLEIAGTDENGVRYWNNDGDAPPKLIVACD